MGGCYKTGAVVRDVVCQPTFFSHISILVYSIDNQLREINVGNIIARKEYGGKAENIHTAASGLISRGNLESDSARTSSFSRTRKKVGEATSPSD